MATPDLSTQAAGNRNVFDGSYYEAWRAQIIATLSSDEEYADTIAPIPTPLELETIALQPSAYQAKHRRFFRRQEAAKAYIFNRLSLPIVNLVRRCYMARDVLETLDEEYRQTSAAAESMARRKFYGMRYVDGDDMGKFLRAFEESADRLRDSGILVTETEKINQLTAALTKDYDIAVTKYQMYVLENHHSFHVLKRFVLDRHERDFDEKELLKRYSEMYVNTSEMEKTEANRRTQQPQNRNRNPPRPAAQTDQTTKETESDRTRRRYNFECTLTCRQCDGFGHIQANCPSKLKTDDTKKNASKETTGTSQSYEDKRSKAKVMMVLPGKPDESDDEPKTKKIAGTFMVDSGAYRHMTSRKELLNKVRQLAVPQQLDCASKGAPLAATHVGEMLVELENRYGETNIMLLMDVLYVPDLEQDLLSENVITKSGQYEITFTKNFADIIDVETDEIAFSAFRKGDAKYVHFEAIVDNHKRPKVLPVQSGEMDDTASTDDDDQDDQDASPVDKQKEEKELWHRRLGHISGKYLKILQSKSDGIPKYLHFNDNDFRDCIPCLMAKSCELGHGTVRRKATRRCDIISTDIMGPFTNGLHGEKFVATFIDNYSNYVTIALLKRKCDVAAAFARYHKRLRNRFPDEPVHILRCDRAKEYIEGDLRDYCDAAGVAIEDASPYSPQLNGKAERMNRTLTERMRAILFDSNMDYKYWPYALETAAYLVNRSPTKNNAELKTPFETWNGYKPELKYLRTFGCTAYRHIPEAVQTQKVSSQRRKGLVDDTKLCPRAEKRVFIGYTATGYNVLDPSTNKLTSSSDIRFLEKTANAPTTKQPANTQDEVNVVRETEPRIEEPESPPAPTPEHQDDAAQVAPESENLDLLASVAVDRDKMANLDMLASIATEKRTRRKKNCPVPRDHDYIAMSVQTKSTERNRAPLLEESVPRTFAEIENNPFKEKWKEAVAKELNAMKQNKVFTVVPRTKRMKPIDTKWCFTIKYTDDGEPYAKARLVARGFRDRNEYKIYETYSPVVKQWMIRWALSITNRRRLSMTKFDVATAFLNADINQTTYLLVPDGSPENRHTSVLKVNKSIYGLKPSSKNWFDLLNDVLTSIGYVQSKSDRCLYYQRSESNKITLLLVYVDDMLLLTDDPKIEERTIQALKNRFELKIQSNPKNFVGFEIKRDIQKSMIYLSQKNYIKRLLQRFDMEDAYPQKTPMDANLKLHKSPSGQDNREYRAMIGCLLYLARGTRPDISFAVNALSRLQSASTNTDKQYVRRIFRYLKGTQEYELPIHSTGEKIEAYIDASYAPNVSEKSPSFDIDDGKSVSGYLVRLFGDPIIWSVKKQTIMASSSTAAEIIAVHDALNDVRVLYLTMQEIFGVNAPVTIWEDNTSATKILMGGDQTKTRSVLIKCYDILTAVAEKEIYLRSVSTTQQLADMLTKPLSREKFQRNTEAIFNPEKDNEDNVAPRASQ